MISTRKAVPLHRHSEMSGGDFLFTNPAKVVYSSHVQRVATRIPDRAQNIHNNENNKDPTDKSIQRSRSFEQREKRKTTKKKEPKKKIKKEKFRCFVSFYKNSQNNKRKET